MNYYSDINSDILRAWCDAPSHFLPPDLRPPTPTHHIQAADSSPRRHRYSPAEISQQSVDLLLREYYAMVMAHRHGGTPKSEESGLLQRAFLLLCPAPPVCLELDHLAKAAAGAVALLAAVLVKAAPVLVPVGLGLLRHVLQQQGPTEAAVLAAAGLTVLLLAGAIHSSRARQRAAADAACITAATLQQQLDAGGASSHELATLRAASKTATAPNSSRPSSITQHAARQQQQQQSPGAVGARSVGGGSAGGSAAAAGGGGGGASYAGMAQDLSALEAALGFSASSSHAVGSREHVVEVLSQVCQQLGVALTGSMTSSPAAMAAAVAQLKQSVGI